MVDGSAAATRYVGVGGMAEALGCSPQTVRNLEAAGVLPSSARVEPGARRVWRVDDLDRVLAQANEKRAAGRQRGDPGRAA